MSNTDKNRKGFEAWIMTLDEWRSLSDPCATSRRSNGNYFYAHIDLAWNAYCKAMSMFRTEAYIIHPVGGDGPELTWHKAPRAIRLYKKKSL